MAFCANMRNIFGLEHNGLYIIHNIYKCNRFNEYECIMLDLSLGSPVDDESSSIKVMVGTNRR